jgi:aspartyl-tRNA(Asn)/glutamyl-tRNA(Gln) amidotransferase subunit C
MLSREQVRHVAALARLSLTPEEEERYQGQLSAVLDAIAQLGALDTTDVEPTSHATLQESPLREDLVLPSLDPEVSLLSAPARVGTHFAVPKIIE